MAKEKNLPKTVLERVYAIPLRRETRKVAPYRKSKKAIRAIKEFILRHMKSKEISIGKHLNKKIWEHGIKNPPGKVKVTAAKDDKGKIFVELFGAKKEAKKEEKKLETAKKEQVIDTKAEKIEEIKEVKEEKDEKQAVAKEVEKEEIKELKKGQKEHPKKQHAPKEAQEPKTQEVHQSGPRHV